jgi:putative membrane protein
MTTGTADLPAATRLALERTRLAYERTLMAWTRTATSLISFGFTIYKFFQFVHEEGRIAHPHSLLGSREFAMLMILTGLVALVLATVQHRVNIKPLRAQSTDAPYSLAGAIALVVGALGIVGLFAVIFRQ